MSATGTTHNAGGDEPELPPPHALAAADDEEGGAPAVGGAALTVDCKNSPTGKGNVVPPAAAPTPTTEHGDDDQPNGKAPPPGRGCIAPHCTKYRKSRCDGYCLSCYRQNGGVWPPVEDLPGSEATTNRDGSAKNPPPGRGCIAEGCRKYCKSRCGGYCLGCFRERGGVWPPPSEGEGEAGERSSGNWGRAIAEGRVSEEGAEDLPPLDDGEMAPLPSLDAAAAMPPLTTTAMPPPAVHFTPPLPALSSAAAPAVVTASHPDKPSKYCRHPNCPKLRQSNCHGYCLTHVKLLDAPTLQSYNYERQHQKAMSRARKTHVHARYLCKFTDCERYVQSNCRGFCLTHVKFARCADSDGEEGADVTKVRVRVENRLRNGFVRAVLPDELRARWGLASGGEGEMGEEPGLGEEQGATMEGDEEGGVGEVSASAMAADDPAAGGGEPRAAASADVRDAILAAAAGGGDNGDEKSGGDDRKPAAMDADTAVALDVDGNISSEAKRHPSEGNTVFVSLKQEELMKAEEKKDDDDAAPPDLSKLDFDIAAAPSRKPNGATRCRAVEKDGTVCDKNSQGLRFANFCRVHHTRYLIGLGKVETWECAPCQKTMTEYQTRCGKCHRWRGGSQIEAMTTVARKRGLLSDGQTVVRAKPKTMEDVRRSLDGNEGGGEEDDDGLTRTRGGMVQPWECGRCGVANADRKKRCGGCLAFRGAGSKVGARPKAAMAGAGLRGDDPIGMQDPSLFLSVETATFNWNCGRCAFANFAGELECYGCGARRGNYEWHKRQKVMGGMCSEERGGEEESEAAVATAMAGVDGEVGTAGAAEKEAVPEPTAPSATNATTPSGDEPLPYYGTCEEGAAFCYVSLHYDFNQAYYRNCQYRYLNEGMAAAADPTGDLS